MSGEGLSAEEHLDVLKDEIFYATDRLSSSEARAVAHAVYNGDWLARRESEAAEKARASSDPIIRYADLGNGPEFDEFIAHNATVHVEAMGRTSWWIGVDLPDGRTWHINLGAMNERAKFYARCDDVTCYPRADSVAQGREETP